MKRFVYVIENIKNPENMFDISCLIHSLRFWSKEVQADFSGARSLVQAAWQQNAITWRGQNRNFRN